MVINPLIVILQPRDIPEFKKAVVEELTQADKLWVSYHTQPEAYKVGRREFLANQRYTHMVLLPDDLIVSKENFIQLVDDIDKNQYKVLSGYCNFDNMSNKELSNISIRSLPPQPAEGLMTQDYDLERMDELNRLREKEGLQIISVKYAGFPFTFIERSIVDLIDFKTPNNCCYDNFFSLSLDKLGVPQYVDLRVQMMHLRISGIQEEQNLKVGIKNPYLRWQLRTN